MYFSCSLRREKPFAGSIYEVSRSKSYMKFFAIIVAFVALSTNAQKELSGFVKSKSSNLPIANARIHIEETVSSGEQN